MTSLAGRGELAGSCAAPAGDRRVRGTLQGAFRFPPRLWRASMTGDSNAPYGARRTGLAHESCGGYARVPPAPSALAAGISCRLDDDASAEARFHGRDSTEAFAHSPGREGSDSMATVETPLDGSEARRDSASATGGNPSRRRYPTPLPGSGRPGARRRGRWRRDPGMANGSRPPIGVIRSSCWRSRLLRGCPSWCRSATGGCWCRRSRSSAGRPTRWRRIWPVRRGPGSRCSSVAMRICRTSVVSPRPIGGWCSASTTSTRRCRARSSGT